jgi:hypothetical protein
VEAANATDEINRINLSWVNAGGGTDAHPNEHRVGSRKAGPARQVPTFDRTNRGIVRNWWTYDGTDGGSNERRVGPRKTGPAQKVPSFDDLITSNGEIYSLSATYTERLIHDCPVVSFLVLYSVSQKPSPNLRTTCHTVSASSTS